MKILVNCSNLKMGGGLQVAHSFLHEIKSCKQHFFFIVLSTSLRKQIDFNKFDENFKFLIYDVHPNIFKIITGHDVFLNRQVKKENIDVVFSVFGPSYWKPRVKHIVGYAKPHYVYRDSPFFKNLSLTESLKLKIKGCFQLIDFSKNNDKLITENKDVSLRLQKIFKKKEIYTVSNYYNQIYDKPEEWNKDVKLTRFDGFTLLTISANYPHKNLSIIPKVIKYLINKYPTFNFRFVVSLKKESLYYIGDRSIDDHLVYLGKLNIDQCPYIYSQVDAVFLPSLLECFTATYPEAMIMQKPILTSNLDFAKGLCGEGAVYFDPLDPSDIGEKIYELAADKKKQQVIRKAGMNRLKYFDSYSERAKKYLEIIVE